MSDLAPSILITDDDRSLRETLRVALEPCGFRTHLAADGEEAVTIVRTQRIHVVLLDMHMPRLTGLETIRLVKQINAALPCILLSAALDEMIVRQAQQLQAFSVLSKPVTRQQLTSTVVSALNQAYGDWKGWSGSEAATG
jgi:CheY-like chemotaxis protein